MTFKETIADYGYEIQPVENPFIKIKKRDEMNVSDIVIIFDSETKTISGGLITIAPIQTIDDIAHQYKIFQEFQKHIKYFSEKTGYDII